MWRKLGGLNGISWGVVEWGGGNSYRGRCGSGW